MRRLPCGSLSDILLDTRVGLLSVACKCDWSLRQSPFHARFLHWRGRYTVKELSNPTSVTTPGPAYPKVTEAKVELLETPSARSAS